ncbi:MAG: nucleotidyl transferase AbiEii/AbiGii toxin family protein [Candidatus Diapherotrites archaeon]|nr:nucleotidyl transferase AbiEii/AbiGii toxin family protein [Candidatus Diapherotrites archaeon]
MHLPLLNRLRKRLHMDIALLQDEVVDIVYSIAPDAVLHGGTAVWRCFSGNRFSEDLDFYLPTAPNNFRERFSSELRSRGLSLLKFKRTGSTVFSKVSNGTVEVRFEASFRKPPGFEPRQFERADGSFMGVFTPTPEDLVLEKIAAFGNRRLVRDAYDLFILTSEAGLGSAALKKLASFSQSPPEPVDEKSLRTVVFSGAVPSFGQIVSALKRRSRT